MGYYRHENLEKSYKLFAEKADSALTASLDLAPHKEYDRDNVYKLKGLGSMFDGTFRMTRVVHTINPSGYTVNADVRMVYDMKGNFVETKTSTSSQNAPAKPQAPVQTKGDKAYTVVSGDTLWGIAKRFCKSPLDWKAIEKANHSILVARDKRNANGAGHWIYPGQKLSIPGTLLK